MLVGLAENDVDPALVGLPPFADRIASEFGVGFPETLADFFLIFVPEACPEWGRACLQNASMNKSRSRSFWSLRKTSFSLSLMI